MRTSRNMVATSTPLAGAFLRLLRLPVECASVDVELLGHLGNIIFAVGHHVFHALAFHGQRGVLTSLG